MQTHIFTSFPETHQEEDLEKLLGDDQLNQQQQGQQNQQTKIQLEENMEEKKYSVWQIEYYQKYFNVSTNDVISRIVGSMTPTFNQNFLLNRIKPNPDLYGPFWISITLIFTVAIAGNILNFLHNFGSPYTWHTDFHKVSTSAAVILTYWWLIPTILYMIIRWRQYIVEFTFIEILCIYGYSLSIYIPISILWIIPVTIIQWTLVAIAVLLSGSVLVFTFWPVFNKDSSNKISFGVMIMIIVLHAMLGISFMLYFFHYSTPFQNLTTTAATEFDTTTIATFNSSLITSG